MRAITALTLLVVAAGPAYGQPPDSTRARDMAATCANCHGTNGVSRGETESLAGRPRDEIASRFREFKAGTRPGTVMPQLAKGFTDAQIDAIAGWFAAQPSK